MGLLDRFIGNLTRGQSAGPYALTDEDRKDLKRQGLLQAGLTMLATPSNGSQGIARGLLAGVQGIQGGADALVNDRYRTDVMQRTRDQMAANTAREQAMRGVLNPDGSLNVEGWQRFAEMDPIEAMRLRVQVNAANAPRPQSFRPTRRVEQDGVIVTEEMDPITGEVRVIGRSPRWQRGVVAGAGGGASASAGAGGAGAATAGGAPQPGEAGQPSGPRPGQPMTAQEIEAWGLPRGTAAMWSAKGEPRILHKPTADEIKQRTAANRMMPQLQAVRRRIDRIRQATENLSNNRFFGTGPLDQFVTSRKPEGQELEAAIGGIQNPLLALTRVPGIGAQSDLEARVANLQFPQLGTDEQANLRTVAELEAFYADLENAFRNVLGDDFPDGDANASAPRPGEVRNGYRFKGGNPADRNSWEKV